MLPAPGQGALGVECRADDEWLLGILRAIHHVPTEVEVTAERAFLAALEAGCNTPVAALARIVKRDGGDYVSFVGRCVSFDGTHTIEVSGEADLSGSHQLGIAMAEEVLSRGFKDL
jgi:hydroxymethylbilane synthase